MRTLFLLTLVLCSCFPALGAAQETCDVSRFDVTLPTGQGPVAATVYLPSRPARVIAILAHGATYDRSYHAGLGAYLAQRGVTSIAVDMLTTPSAGIVEQGYMLADVATSVADWSPRHREHRVIIVGHSMGAMAATVADSVAPDAIDGLVLQGYSHVAGPTALASFGLAVPGPTPGLLTTASTFPPGFVIPPGFDYLRNPPGVREFLFFYSPAVSAATLAADEANKREYPAAMLSDIFDGDAFTASFGVTAHTFLQAGQYDFIACEMPGCDETALAQSEAPTFPGAASFDAEVLPRLGHSAALHRAPVRVYQGVHRWIRDTF